ncbi:PrsW family intramembrane metalloprotease [bacterium]|nr:PrsW family intramembrane metalloprotease [bacterium]
MSHGTDSVFDEPALRAPARPVDAVLHEVWSEPGRMPSSHPAVGTLTYADMLSERWQQATPCVSWLVVAALALAAGPFAVLAALLKTSAAHIAIAAVIMAPLIEELGKAAAPLIVLERWPYRFLSSTQLVFVCAVSGAIFAGIENLLYLKILLRQPDAALVLWRWTVCVALHVGCSLIAGMGLRRIWLISRATLTRPDVSLAAPYFITAMILHGSYNMLVLLLAITQAEGMSP